MKKLYIKFEEWNKESLQRAVDEAERVGYTKHYGASALSFEWQSILQCDEDWTYYTSRIKEETLQYEWYKEYKIEQYQEWDWVYVRDSEDQERKKRIYLHTLPNKDSGHICVSMCYENEYQNGYNYGIDFWKYIKPYTDKVKIKTEDWQSMEIEKEKAEDLWFNFNE